MLHDPSAERLLQVHLLLSATASVVAFAAYYSCSGHRSNPAFAGQLHCLSGMILCNRPLFSTLLCGLAGALLAALLPADAIGVALLLGMYWALVVVVQYDVHSHAAVHFGALAAEMGLATAYVAVMGDGGPASLVYYAATGAFLLVMAVNFTCLLWTPPFMTVQALVEVAWVCALGVCLGQMALADG